jgi:hypothetical protein
MKERMKERKEGRKKPIHPSDKPMSYTVAR